MRRENNAPIVQQATVDLLVKLCQAPGVAMLALDPMARLHELNENDNGEMTQVVAIVSDIASRAGVGIVMPHHLAKPNLANFNAYVGNAYAGRGAGAISEASRIAVTLASPTDDDMARYSLPLGERQRLVRLDDAKLNHGLMRGEPVWLRKETVMLPNGEEVGAFGPADVQAIADNARANVASLLYVELMHASSSHMTVPEAAACLMRYDPVWSRLPPEVVRKRIEAMLSQPAHVTGHGSIVLKVEGLKKSVVLE